MRTQTVSRRGFVEKGPVVSNELSIGRGLGLSESKSIVRRIVTIGLKFRHR